MTVSEFLSGHKLIILHDLHGNTIENKFISTTLEVLAVARRCLAWSCHAGRPCHTPGFIDSKQCGFGVDDSHEVRDAGPTWQADRRGRLKWSRNRCSWQARRMGNCRLDLLRSCRHPESSARQHAFEDSPQRAPVWSDSAAQHAVRHIRIARDCGRSIPTTSLTAEPHATMAKMRTIRACLDFAKPMPC